MPEARLQLDLEYVATALGLDPCIIMAGKVSGGQLVLRIEAPDIPPDIEDVTVIVTERLRTRRFEKVQR